MSKIKEYTTTKIVICDICKGSGKIEQSECVDYHHNDYDHWDVVCRCNGLGRLKETTTITLSTLTEEELKVRERSKDLWNG